MWLSDKSYVSPFSARAPVSHQFRMREPGTSLALGGGGAQPSTAYRLPPGVGGGDVLICWPLTLRCLACPCQKRRS